MSAHIGLAKVYYEIGKFDQSLTQLNTADSLCNLLQGFPQEEIDEERGNIILNYAGLWRMQKDIVRLLSITKRAWALPGETI